MKNSIKEAGQRLGNMPASARHAALSSDLLILTKSNSKSRVHRPAYVDYIGIKRFDEHGKVVGEDRFIGLYASSIYNTSATQIPLISHRLEHIMAASGHEKGSHAYKALLNVLETYPRDELIQAREEELLATGLGVLEMQERDMLRLFVRRDVYYRFFLHGLCHQGALQHGAAGQDPADPAEVFWQQRRGGVQRLLHRGRAGTDPLHSAGQQQQRGCGCERSTEQPD